MKNDELLQSLSNLPIPEIRSYDSIGSTNDVGLDWLETGAADGSLVIADQQTKGRGRLGRTWVTRPGTALAFSLILRVTQGEVRHSGLFSPLAGLAVCRALQGLGLPAEIKWPNDVLLARRKTCGILAESSWEGNRLDGVVIGIGINVAPGSVPPGEELQFPATCVEEHLGHSVERSLLLHQILKEFFSWRPCLGTEAFFRAWEERLAFKGETVYITNSSGGTLSGSLLGVDVDGKLRVRTAGGDVKIISVGDVHLRPEDVMRSSGR